MMGAGARRDRLAHDEAAQIFLARQAAGRGAAVQMRQLLICQPQRNHMAALAHGITALDFCPVVLLSLAAEAV